MYQHCCNFTGGQISIGYILLFEMFRDYSDNFVFSSLISNVHLSRTLVNKIHMMY